MSKTNQEEEFAIGLITVVVVNLTLFFLGFVWYAFFKKGALLEFWSIYSLSLLGFVQFIYVAPLIIWHGIRGNKKYTYGIVAGGLLTLAVSILAIVYIASMFSGTFR